MVLPPFANIGQYEVAFGAYDVRTTLDLAAASTAIRNYCRWNIYPQVTEVLVLDGPGSPVLLLPVKHVSAVTACTETLHGIGQTPVTLDVSQLEWSAAGMVWRGDHRCWTNRARGITITVTSGYVEPPADLAKLTLDHAHRSASNPGGLLASDQAGQRMQSYRAGAGGAGFMQDELAVLEAYRRLV